MFEPFDSPPRLDTDKAELCPDFTPDSPSRTPTEITNIEGAMALGGAVRQELPAIVGHTASRHCTPQQPDTESAPQTSRKGKVVYKPKTIKRDPRSQANSSTRRRQLPVNGLALVKSSTVDGLPEPSGTDNGSSSPPYISADPIQDSQADWPTASISKYRHVQTLPARSARQNVSSRKYTWTSHKDFIKRERGQAFRLVNHSRIRHRQLSSFERVADGFIGSEFILTSRPKKPFATPQNWKQKPTPRLKQETALKSQGLVLTTGYLPDQPVRSIVPQFTSTPNALGAAPRYDLSSTPPELEFDFTLPPYAQPRFGEVAMSQARAPWEDQLAMCGHEQSTTPTSAHSAGAQNLNRPITPASRRATDAEVLNQLSSIRAPIREESSSEENDEEEPDEGSSAVDDEDGCQSYTNSDAYCHSSIVNQRLAHGFATPDVALSDPETILVDGVTYFQDAVQYLEAETDMLIR